MLRWHARIILILTSMTVSGALAKDSLQNAKLVESFSYLAPEALFPSHSGLGPTSRRVYADLKFPIQFDPAVDFAVPSSMVYSFGGSGGPAGSQFAPENKRLPARGNFCEHRGFGTPACPSGKGHQGCDIRAAKDAPVLAAEDGELLASTQSWSIRLVSSSGSGITYVYRHLTPESVKAALSGSRKVKKGDRIGNVGNIQGYSKKKKKYEYTHYHLHLEMLGSDTFGGKTYLNTPLPCAPSLSKG